MNSRFREDVVAPVFRSVRKVRAVGPDRSGNQQRTRIRVFVQVLAARLVGQAHTQCHPFQGFCLADAALRKSQRRGLIARRDGDSGSGAEVIVVYAA